MSESDERELSAGLRRHFAERADESAAPPFARIWSAARASEQASEHEKRRRPVWRRSPWTPAAAGAAVLVLAAWLWPSLPAEPEPEPELAALLASAAALTTDWEAPLDFLLTTPGLELIETTPSFGPSGEQEEEEETNADGAQSSRPRKRMTT